VNDQLWYQDAIIYEMHVKAFYDSNADGVGDFRGLTEKLDYLQDLGVTAVWLLPFYPSPLKDDGYDISDYHGIHPDYGTLRDFKQFLRAAHRRRLKVITELVINHTSDQHPWFQAARRSPPGSAKRDYYVWSDTPEKYKDARIIFTDTEKSNWTWDEEARAYYWHRFFSHQPDLNFDNPSVRRAVMRTMRFWLDMGVDGLRLDAIPYLIERDGTNCENLAETHETLKELRAALDAHYTGRVFLAEANQWPADVRPYFGDGDECHMAFHFPLMPRMFMAIRQEDRFPIVEIMRQTPEIPDTCQWALFLRNHDELTLEMVTDEERDYMYREYAADPRMKINLGIRRRLAPLLDQGRRRIELLNSLLFSLRGSPIIYYGDELGMGDNIYLGDRNGVRTPMQWSGDRNAGFSRADPQRLYSPLILDPVYNYQAVNVEAQERSPSSLLRWMKRLIAVRKQNPVFGRGSLRFLYPENRKVLVYVRQHEADTVLCVANMSRFVQPAEIDLSEFKGHRPVEMIGNVPFPPIGELPYFLTLGPHGFYWFRLLPPESPPDERIEIRTPPADIDLPRLDATTPGVGPEVAMEAAAERLFEGASLDVIERELLLAFLPAQRWYGAKGRQLVSTRIVERAALPGDDAYRALCIVECAFADGPPERYLVPLALTPSPHAWSVWAAMPGQALARVNLPQGEALLHDALADDRTAAVLLQLIRDGRGVAGLAGRFRTLRGAGLDEATRTLPHPLAVRRMGVDQSNTSVVFEDRLVLKVIRRVQAGVNPDLELGRYLTDDAAFRSVPPLVGAIEHEADQALSTTAILQRFVPSRGDGWSFTLDYLSRYFEAVGTYTSEHPGAEPGEAVPRDFGSDLAAFLDGLKLLGKRIGELHHAFARAPGPDLAPEPLTVADVAAVADRVARVELPSALSELERSLDRLEPPARDLAGRVLAARDRLAALLSEVSARELRGLRIRHHGDLHLGQVLRSDSDWIILDFEGEPARPLDERRTKQSPLRDVAGMLRSLSYAAHMGLRSASEGRSQDLPWLSRWAHAWEAWATDALLEGYLEGAWEGGFLSEDEQDTALLIGIYLLEKAFYELLYELNNRPSWVVVPLAGILRLLESGASDD
jgi:maltose alpha-D-glucosyltransferase/alpha-amylase